MSRQQPELHLRSFQPADAALVASWLLGPGLSPPPGTCNADWPARMVADPHILARVAVRQDRIVAFARLDCGPDGVAELTLVVAPDLRRQGLGREVLDLLLAAARERGVVRLQAMVDPQGQDAMLFFRECGFEEHGRLGDRVRFVRTLQQQFEPTPLEIEL